MRCRSCGSRTRVVCTEHEHDVTHRWLRCLKCEALTRTCETYLHPKPGPKPGTPKPVPGPMGSRNGASVLTEDDVIRLRRQAASGIPQKNLAREYGIAPETVSRIVTRKTWTHV